MRSIKSLLIPASISLCVLAGGCQEEGYVTLFDEDGTWSLISHDVEGSGTFKTIDSANREDKFLLRFVRTSAAESEPAGKLAAATCIDVSDDSGLTTSSCNDGFTCRCFNYSFNETTMIFTEFEGEGGFLYTPAEGEPAPGEPVAVVVSEVEDNNVTFVFRPLPSRLFESDATGSAYELRQKANSLFVETGCSEICGLE